MKVYSRGYIVQVWCVDRDKAKKYTLLDGMEDLVCILVFIVIAIPLYRSLAFQVLFNSPLKINKQDKSIELFSYVQIY